MTKFPVKEPRRNLVFGFILSLSVLQTSTSISFAQGAYGGSEYMDGPPQPFRPPTSELTQVPPPEAPPPSPGDGWQSGGYRSRDDGQPWGSPSWGVSQYPNGGGYGGWRQQDFAPWGGMIMDGLISGPGYGYPQSMPSRTCVDQVCTGD